MHSPRRSAGRLAVAAAIVFAAGADWTHFRGNDTNSVSQQRNLPVALERHDYVAWKTPLPGRGPSSPIVVAGRVVVTCSSGPREDRLHVLCIDAQSGKLHWQRQLWATGHTVAHPFGAVGAPTPASDGQRVFAFFSSNDLACFDLQGNLKWFRGLAYDDPSVRNDVGMASSPLVLGATLIVQLDTPADSFVAGLDVATGETRWRLPRDKGAIWASPTVLRGKGPEEDLVLLQSRTRLTAHDPQTGRQLWDYEASCHTIASATTCDGVAYLPANGLHALRYDPQRRATELLWHEPRLRSTNASPVVHDGRAYVIKSPAILACGDATDGRILWQLRLEGPTWASPVLADGHLYFVSHKGLVQVVRLGERDAEVVGTLQIDPGVLATPAVADGAVYFRTDQNLWKLAKD